MRLRIRTILLPLLLALPQAGPAQQPQPQPRTLEVPATAAWQHAATQMILPSASAGLTRGAIEDSTAREFDVAATYRNRDEGLLATLYLYKTMTPDIALWFDRALAAILMRTEYGIDAGAAPAAAAFARPGAQAASGLRIALDAGGAEIRSTALAVVPLGRYLLKIRLSSSRLDRAALDERLTRFIEGLRWPAAAAGERAAVPVAPCATPLRLRSARVLRDSGMGNVLSDAMGGMLIERAEQDGDGPPPRPYCREPGATLAHGVYRRGGATDSYLIALGDDGIALSIGQALDLSALLGGGGGGRTRFSMTMLGRDGTTVYPSFNRLPPPAQALSVAMEGGPRISVSSGDSENR